MWKSAATLARLKFSTKSLSGKSLSMDEVASAGSTQQQIHEAALLKRCLQQKAKERKVMSLGESILYFLQMGPDLDALMRASAARSSMASYRARFNSYLDHIDSLKQQYFCFS